MHRLFNQVRDYPWGSRTAIPDLIGTEVTGEPQAEMWIGAHPDSPSTTADGRRLDDVIATDPAGILGSVAAGFGRLPFLLKVLAAAEPLSLQVHPTTEQAERGFAAEEAAGVPRDAAHRRYKDPHHKPEMLVALTEFDALCGFRTAHDALQVVSGLDVAHPGWPPLVAALRDRDGVQAVFTQVLRHPDPSLVDAVAQACAARRADGCAHDLEDDTVVGLASRYPGDAGVVASLLLNRVVLAPGEAIYLPAGNVHAYLHGLGLEVLANSDNVLRAGLTSKFMDVAEVLAVVDFGGAGVPYVDARYHHGLTTYRSAAAEFALDIMMLRDGLPTPPLPDRGPRLVFVVSGSARAAAGGQELSLRRGQSAFLGDDDGPLTLTGKGRVAVVSVPSR